MGRRPGRKAVHAAHRADEKNKVKVPSYEKGLQEKRTVNDQWKFPPISHRCRAREVLIFICPPRVIVAHGAVLRAEKGPQRALGCRRMVVMNEPSF